MQNKLRLGIMGGLLAIGAGFIVWQGWNTHQLQQQVDTLQQQLAAQSASSPPGGTITHQLQPQSPPGGAGNAPLNGSPFGNSPFGSDPFADMQRMQQQMHQRMQQLMQDFGMNAPLFDMDPFAGGSGFSSSMGFGAQPDFEFSEGEHEYVVTVKIPEGSNVEISTEVKDHELTIQGKVSVEEKNQNNGGAFTSVQTQQFARTLTLPGDVDVLGITNETVGDEVRIKLPKQKAGSGL